MYITFVHNILTFFSWPKFNQGQIKQLSKSFDKEKAIDVDVDQRVYFTTINTLMYIIFVMINQNFKEFLVTKRYSWPLEMIKCIL